MIFIGFLSCMCFYVFGAQFSAKGLTHSFKRFLSMYSFMYLELNVLCKGFTTLVTFRKFLSSIYSLKVLKRTVRYKVFTTLVTHKGFLSSNCCFMNLETTVTGKGGFKILDIFMEFLSSMNSFLSLVMSLKCKGFPTLKNLRGLLFSMTSFISVKTIPTCESFLTFKTHMNLFICVNKVYNLD